MIYTAGRFEFRLVNSMWESYLERIMTSNEEVIVNIIPDDEGDDFLRIQHADGSCKTLKIQILSE